MGFVPGNRLIWGRRAWILSKLWKVGILWERYRLSTFIVQSGVY